MRVLIEESEKGTLTDWRVRGVDRSEILKDSRPESYTHRLETIKAVKG